MEEVKCYLYWIHTSNQKDIFSEGYVGVSRNPDYRFYQHIRNGINPKQHKNYRTEFREAMERNEAIYEIILCSTSEYCYYIESKLRPTWKIGWNLAAGGAGGFGTHGLSSTKERGCYYNVLTKAKEDGIKVCESWLGSGGLVNFCSFYKENVKEGFILSTKGLSFISPETVIICEQGDMIRERMRVHDLYGNGVLYNIQEISEITGVRPNTISTNLSRGFTLQQSAGIEPKPMKTVVIKDQFYKYSGKFTEEDLQNIQRDYEQGKTLENMSITYEIDSGNLSKLVRRFGFERKSRIFVDLMGGTFSTNLKSAIDAEGYELLIKNLKDGIPRYKIAELLDISGSSITALCKRIKWDEYKESMGRSATHMANEG